MNSQLSQQTTTSTGVKATLRGSVDIAEAKVQNSPIALSIKTAANNTYDSPFFHSKHSSLKQGEKEIYKSTSLSHSGSSLVPEDSSILGPIAAETTIRAGFRGEKVSTPTADVRNSDNKNKEQDENKCSQPKSMCLNKKAQRASTRSSNVQHGHGLSVPTATTSSTTTVESLAKKEGCREGSVSSIVDAANIISESSNDFKNHRQKTNDATTSASQEIACAQQPSHPQTSEEKSNVATTKHDDDNNVFKVWTKEEEKDATLFLEDLLGLSNNHQQQNDNKETASVSEQTITNRTFVGSSVRRRLISSSNDASTNDHSCLDLFPSDATLLSFQDNLAENGRRADENNELKTLSKKLDKKIALASQPINISIRDLGGFAGDIKNRRSTSEGQANVHSNDDDAIDEKQEREVLYLVKLLHLKHDNANQELQMKGKKTFERMWKIFF